MSISGIRNRLHENTVYWVKKPSKDDTLVTIIRWIVITYLDIFFFFCTIYVLSVQKGLHGIERDERVWVGRKTVEEYFIEAFGFSVNSFNFRFVKILVWYVWGRIFLNFPRRYFGRIGFCWGWTFFHSSTVKDRMSKSISIMFC